MNTPVIVRAATREDLGPLGAFAAALVRYHHELDPRRFFLPPNVEEGYRGWFARELASPDAILLAAELPAVEGSAAARVVGYAYGRVEAHDWNLLLDRHTALHDILVADDARGHHVADGLCEAFIAVAEARGAPRIVLHTAVANERAQALFRKQGFRPTMIEMTRG